MAGALDGPLPSTAGIKILIGPGTYRRDYPTNSGASDLPFDLSPYDGKNLTSGHRRMPLVFQAEIPGSVIIDGSWPIASSTLTKVQEFDYVYQARMQQCTNCYSCYKAAMAIETDTSKNLRLVPSIYDCEQMANTYYPDLKNNKFYVHASDSEPANTHTYAISHSAYGIFPTTPIQYTIFDGLTMTGFLYYGIRMYRNDHVTIKNGNFYNIGSVAIGVDGPSEFTRITNNFFNTNSDGRMGSSGGHVMLSNAAHYTSVDHCFFGTTPLNALRHYGGTPGPADDPYNSLGTVFRNNLFSGNMYAAIEYKGTGDTSHGSSFFNSVYKAGTLYFTEQPQFNLSNNIYCYGCAVGPDEPIPPSNITGTINDASYTTYFADPAHLDFRLQNVPASPYIGSLTEKPAPGAVHDPLIGNLDVSSYDDKGPYQFYENLPGEDNWDGYGKHGRALFVSPSGTGNGYAKSTPISITQALTLAAPGDTIYLIGGIYTAPISIDCSVQQSAPTCVKGLKNRPITISGYGNDTVQISGISINTSEYLVLQSLIIENNIENGIHIKESHDITIQNNRILNNTKTGILQKT